MTTLSTTSHLTDRFVVSDANRQHYGNFPSLETAERHARKIAKVTGYTEVTYNGNRYYIATGE